VLVAYRVSGRRQRRLSLPAYLRTSPTAKDAIASAQPAKAHSAIDEPFAARGGSPLAFGGFGFRGRCFFDAERTSEPRRLVQARLVVRIARGRAEGRGFESIIRFFSLSSSLLSPRPTYSSGEPGTFLGSGADRCLAECVCAHWCPFERSVCQVVPAGSDADQVLESLT
jgi:hypothetical protein